MDEGEHSKGTGHTEGSLKPHEIIQDWTSSGRTRLFMETSSSHYLEAQTAQRDSWGVSSAHPAKQEGSPQKNGTGSDQSNLSSGADTKQQELSPFTASFSVPSAGIMMLQTLARMVSGRRLVVLMGTKDTRVCPKCEGCYATHISPDMVASLQW